MTERNGLFASLHSMHTFSVFFFFFFSLNLFCYVFVLFCSVFLFLLIFQAITSSILFHLVVENLFLHIFLIIMITIPCSGMFRNVPCSGFIDGPFRQRRLRNAEGYRMVFASICEHASSAFLFASTSSDQFSHASSEHFRNYKWRAASTS